MTTWTDTLKARLRERTITESELRFMRRRLREAFNDRCAYCTSLEAEEVVELIAHIRPSVSPAQALKGVNWLMRLAFRKDGKPRATDAAREFRDTDRQTLQDCCAHPRFALIGFDEQTDGYGHLANLAPIYRCFGRDSMFFDYVSSAWQSGGAFTIVQHAYWPVAKVAA